MLTQRTYTWQAQQDPNRCPACGGELRVRLLPRDWSHDHKVLCNDVNCGYRAWITDHLRQSEHEGGRPA
jgi:hypothetical protein